MDVWKVYWAGCSTGTQHILLPKFSALCSESETESTLKIPRPKLYNSNSTANSYSIWLITTKLIRVEHIFLIIFKLRLFVRLVVIFQPENGKSFGIFSE